LLAAGRHHNVLAARLKVNEIRTVRQFERDAPIGAISCDISGQRRNADRLFTTFGFGAEYQRGAILLRLSGHDG
jgi:hypothetical protein